MSKYEIIAKNTLIAACVSCSGILVAAENQHPRPNIIMCMADDLGWGSVGYNGAKVIKTPELDKMAAEGIRFDRFYSAAPVCAPTRASCLTGRHPSRTGVFSTAVGILRPEEITIAEILKDHGYTTAHFGKWHLGLMDKDAPPKKFRIYSHPKMHGFDEYFTSEIKVPTWDPMIKPVNFETDETVRLGWRAVEPGEKSEPYGTTYHTQNGPATENLNGDSSRVLMDRAIPFIERAVKAKKPFLAVIWFHAPHKPCVAGPEYAKMYKDQDFLMQQYAGCITAMDDQLGRLRNKLKELGVDGNTILCFTSDNGPEHNAPGVTGGFRDRKRSLYEGGVRVPSLITWPNEFKTPMVIKEACVTSDYLPTFLDALKIPMPKGANKLDGLSFLPLLEGKEFTRPSPIGFDYGEQISFTGDKYKIYRKKTTGKIELYDLQNDPFETKDIAGKHPEVVQEFKKNFDQWFNSCKDSFEGKEYGTDSLEKLPQSWSDLTREKKKKNKKKKRINK